LLNKGTGKFEWLTRGVGDVKLLQNKETGMIRILMRQEKTLKIRINHQIDPRISITPHPLMEGTYIWRAHDFADNVALVETTFALKFKEQDNADAFSAAFQAAQAHMKSLGYGVEDDNGETPSGEATTSASAATDELTGALAGLSTSENAAEEAKES
jgi:Ran-binding protein 1